MTQSNIEFLYEQLRKATDGGSESMTHDDALKQIAYWRDQAAQLRGASDAQGLTTVPAHTTRESSGHPTIEANNDHVICPNCCNQFRAIPVNVQTELFGAQKAMRLALEAHQAFVDCDSGDSDDGMGMMIAYADALEMAKSAIAALEKEIG